jgi:hypothetical protein
MTKRSEVTINTDAAWIALTRSRQFQKMLKNVAKEVEEEAAALAGILAYDEGWYAQAMQSATMSSKKADRLTNRDDQAWRQRRRRGQRGANRYLDYFVQDDPTTKYEGQLGIVVNTERTAALIEYGSIFEGPRRIMLQAAEAVGERYGIEVEVLYDRTQEADPARVSELNTARAKRPRPKARRGAK